MGINKQNQIILKNIILYINTILSKKTKKIVILILFNISDHIKSKNKNYTSCS